MENECRKLLMFLKSYFVYKLLQVTVPSNGHASMTLGGLCCLKPSDMQSSFDLNQLIDNLQSRHLDPMLLDRIKAFIICISFEYLSYLLT